MEITKQIFDEVDQNSSFQFFIPITIVLTLFTLASVLFLGSLLPTIILATIIGLGILITSYRVALALLIISMMIDLPFLHIPPTESLALRVNDIILFALLLKTILNRRSPTIITEKKLSKSFELILTLSYISLIFSFFMSMSGGTLNYKVNTSFVALIILNVARSMGYIWLFYFVTQYVDEKDRGFFLNFIYLSIFIACLYALAEYLHLAPNLWQTLPNPWRVNYWELFGRRDIVGTFNKNHVHIGLITVYGFLMGCVPFLQNTKKQSTYFIMQIIIMMILLVSQKRAAIPAVIVGCIILFFLYRQKGAKFNFIWLVVGCLLLITVFILNTDFATVVNTRIAPVLEGFQERDIYSSTGGRFHKWEDAWTFLKYVPETILFGQGIGFQIVFDYRELGFQSYIQPHNEWLSLITERGILGLSVVILFLFTTIKTSFKIINTNTKNNYLYNQALISFICAGLVFSNASRVFTVNDPTGSFLGIFMITVALVLGDQVMKKVNQQQI